LLFCPRGVGIRPNCAAWAAPGLRGRSLRIAANLERHPG